MEVAGVRAGFDPNHELDRAGRSRPADRYWEKLALYASIYVARRRRYYSRRASSVIEG